MHACALALELGIPRVLVPAHPGILSALGVAIADIVKDYSRTVMLRDEAVSRARLEEEFHGMEGLAREELGREGLPIDRMEARRFLDARYVGQSFELTIDYPSPSSRKDLGRSISDRFYQAHLRRFGYADRRERIEIVNLRLKLQLVMDKPKLAIQHASTPDPSAAGMGEASVVFPTGSVATALYDRDKLESGAVLQGPCLVIQMDATIVVPPGWGGTVDSYGNLVLEPEKNG